MVVVTRKKRCKRCRAAKPIEAFYPNYERTKETQATHGATCRRCENDRILANRAKKRKELLDLMGGQCVGCGFSDYRALQIDHVHGGGRADRGNLSPDAFYRKVREYLDRYQLLCANCNTIKKVENDESTIKW